MFNKQVIPIDDGVLVGVHNLSRQIYVVCHHWICIDAGGIEFQCNDVDTKIMTVDLLS